MDTLIESELNPGPIATYPGDAKVVWHEYWLQHLKTSFIFASMSAEFEDNFHKGELTHRESRLHPCYVLSSIIAATCFLEATINALFGYAADAAWELPGYETPDTYKDMCHPYLNQLPETVVKKLQSEWDQGIGSKSGPTIIDKYKKAVDLRYEGLPEKEALDKGSSLCQNVKIGIELRDYFIHAKPDKIVVKSPDPKLVTVHKFETKLRKLIEPKYGLNPIVKDANFFPDKCLGSGCAYWVLDTYLDFTKEFFRKMKMPPFYEPYLSDADIRIQEAGGNLDNFLLLN